MEVVDVAVPGAPEGGAPLVIGQFRVVGELGKGGMGLVYEAYDPELARAVAIKVVRDRRAGSATGTRLIAEAQAMAKLDHPNVVGVHEVGTHDHQVYVVMELVRGETLAAWLEQPRSWREIVGMFLQAGEGLRAAHRAGLIHRDFKPSNVLIDRDGRARVGDFGLARSEERLAMPAAFAVGSGAGPAGTGAAGTPAYMPPEQRFGEALDARADQFAFAVSLARALGGARGTPGRRVRAAIAKASELEREARFATMDELLAELRAGLVSRRRRVALVGAVLVVVAGVAGAIVSSRPAGSSCDDGEVLADHVWGPPARMAQLGAFLRARPDAAVASVTAMTIVDDWVERWKLGRKSACAVEPPQRDVRIGCLDSGLLELRAQVALWTSADPAVIDHAVRAASALPQPQTCATSAGRLDPAVRDQLAELKALLHSGRTRQAHARVASLVAAAERVASPQTLAAALLIAGRIEREAGNLTAARDHLKRAAREAGRAADDALLVEALLEESTVIVDLGRPQDALGLLDAAEALQVRAKLDVGERIGLRRADALGQAGRPVESIVESMRVLPALELRAQRDRGARAELTTALGQLAAAQLQIDREAARTTLVRVLEIDEAQYGPDHPEVAKSLHDLGAAELQLEKLDDATAHLDRALAIFLRAYGERHPMVSATYMTIANVARMRGELDRAKQLYLSARQALVGLVPDDAAHFITIESGLGDIARAQDDCRAALPHYRRAVNLLERSGQHENDHATQLTNLGYCLQDVGRVAEARPVLERSLAELERLQMPKKWRAEPLAILADLEAAAGRRARAIELDRLALAALDGEQGSDVAAMREYIAAQIKTWSRR